MTFHSHKTPSHGVKTSLAAAWLGLKKKKEVNHITAITASDAVWPVQSDPSVLSQRPLSDRRQDFQWFQMVNREGMRHIIQCPFKSHAALSPDSYRRHCPVVRQHILFGKHTHKHIVLLKLLVGHHFGVENIFGVGKSWRAKLRPCLVSCRVLKWVRRYQCEWFNRTRRSPPVPVAAWSSLRLQAVQHNPLNTG